MKSTLLALFLLATTRIYSQEPCPCVQKLDTLVHVVSHDYAGFYDKVYAGDRVRYEAFTDSLRGIASKAFEEDQCLKVREAYCAYFQDKLLRLIEPLEKMARRNAMDSKPRTTPWTADSLMKHLDAHRNELHELEGIWTLEGYEFGLLWQDSLELYHAVVMRAPSAPWKEGMLKFTLAPFGPDSAQIDYWTTDMRFRRFTSFRSDGHMAFHELGVLHRTLPTAPDSLERMAFELAHGHETQWRLLADSTLYIKVATCRPRSRAIIDSLVKSNTALLDRVPALIIDVRQNWGGHTDPFRNLMPYLSTRPYRDPGIKYWMSAANTALLGSWVQGFDADFPRKQKRSYERWIRDSKALPNTWSGSSIRSFLPPNARASQKRVVLLADSATAGQAELFLIDARGLSAQTLVMGEPTSGSVDYYGHIVRRSLGTDEPFLVLPMARRNWLADGTSYDRTGVRPDVPIALGVRDHVSFVQHHWSTH